VKVSLKAKRRLKPWYASLPFQGIRVRTNYYRTAEEAAKVIAQRGIHLLLD